MLKTGQEYVESLRDGRVVLAADGSRVEDVPTHPQFRNGVATIAELYDLQHRPDSVDIATYHDEETGVRESRAWQVPRSREDLVNRRRLAKMSTYHTFGVFGRPPDYGSFNALGLLSVSDRLRGTPGGAENVERFVRWGRDHNAMSADVVADVQSDRSVPTSRKPGRLRCVEKRKDGIVLFGAKPCASIAVQAHVGTIVTLLTPAADPEANVFCYVPLNAPNLTMVAREAVVQASGLRDHVLDARGEEPDSLLVFDHVFVPDEQVFSFRDEQMLGLYHEVGALALWHTLSRMAYKAEILAGAAQCVVEVLGTENLPQVRDSIAAITSYATTLKAFVLASEERAQVVNGVMVPSERFVTSGRLHAVEHYPRVTQTIRDISGQGLVSRFSSAHFDDRVIGPLLDEFLPGTGVDAQTKNRLFHLVWDLTCSSAASRVALFESVNATPASSMRARIYDSSYRTPWRDFIREHLDESVGAHLDLSG